MSGDSRNTHGGQQAAQGTAPGALDSFIVGMIDARDDARYAALVGRCVQAQVNPLCAGPTGPCVHPDGLGHEGDHIRPEVIPSGKVQTRCSWCGRLVCTGPLVDGLESHGIHDKCRKEMR